MGRFIARLPVVITFLFKIEDASLSDSGRGFQPSFFSCVGLEVPFIREQFDHQDIGQRWTRTLQMT